MKGLGRAQHHVAIHVVLKMLLRLVAHAHRPHAPVAAQVGHDLLGQFVLQAQAIERLNVAAACAHHNVEEPAHIVFHGADFRQAVERADDKKSIAQPAVAVVPVAPAARCLRDAGGHGRHDGAGVLVERELERDGRAYDGLLPLQRDVQALAPAPPKAQGFLLKQAGGVSNALVQRFVGAQQKVVLASQQKGLARQQVRDGRVGVEAQRQIGPHIAHMVAAAGDDGGSAAPVVAQVHRHADARRALERPHPAHDGGGFEKPRARKKSRRKVGDLQALTQAVKQLGFEHGGVGLVPLAAVGKVLNFYGKGAAPRVQPALGVQQGAEHRVTVKARQAAPHDAAALVDQRAEGAVANHAQGQRRWRGGAEGGRGLGSVHGRVRRAELGAVDVAGIGASCEGQSAKV